MIKYRSVLILLLFFLFSINQNITASDFHSRLNVPHYSLFISHSSFVISDSSLFISHLNHYTWSPELRQAYEAAISLRFAKCEELLKSIKKSDPENLLILLVENYLDFFKVYINEDFSEFEKLEKNKDRRLKEIERHGEDESPWHLYVQADIRLQWALARLKFEEYATSFFETNKAYKLLEKNDGKFPDFMPNKKDLGILHAMVGTIPDNYKWAVDLFSSLDGTIEQGRGELEEVIAHAQGNEDFIFEKEIYVYYAYLMLHLGNESEEAWRIIKQSGLDANTDPMACFILANLAMRTDRGDEAIRILEHRPNGAEFHPFHYLDYMTGLVKLQRLDTDADLYLLRFTENFRGRNFIKDAYQKLAWHALLQGNAEGFKKFMKRCESSGYTVVGSDKSADEEARRGEVPQADLLRARLLFDGGRFQRAYDLLAQKRESGFFSTKNKLEFTYRFGRISHKLGKYEEALKLYDKTIGNGEKEPWYFACRAALEKGHVLEAMGRPDKAAEAFERCLDISPDEHKTGLHQQAKAGLRRVKK